MGKRWKIAAKDQSLDTVGEMGDAIAYSGMNVHVETDDDTGITIGTYGAEHKTQ
jgi:hypothetical protein